MNWLVRTALGLAALLSVVLVAADLSGKATVGAVSPAGYTVISKQAGIDTCAAPTSSAMANWWAFSPYYDVGIYIGGVNRGCNQPNLTSSWVSTVHEQGWGFVPTWVGPQAPCWPYAGTKLSYDQNTAALQGINEANQAANAGASLGFTTGTIIYYDMEAYDTNNTPCRRAVDVFIRGWNYRLHQL